MNKVTATALAALIAFATILPASSTPADARRRGAKIAAGVVLGAAALAIIANSNRANASSYNGPSRWQRQCNRLYNRCVNGNDYACEKYETGGCTE